MCGRSLGCGRISCISLVCSLTRPGVKESHAGRMYEAVLSLDSDASNINGLLLKWTPAAAKCVTVSLARDCSSVQHR